MKDNAGVIGLVIELFFAPYLLYKYMNYVCFKNPGGHRRANEYEAFSYIMKVAPFVGPNVVESQ